MNRFLLIILFIATTFVSTFAQKQQIALADEAYDNFLFKDAIAGYEEALNANNPKYQKYLYEQLAKSYKYSFQYPKAAYYFEKLLALEDKNVNVDYLLEHAIMLKFNGKYQEAKEQLRKYQKITGGEDPYGSFQMRSLNWAIKNDTVINPNIIVSPTNLDVSGQSLGYALFDEGIIYAHGRNKEPYYSNPIFDLDYAKRTDSIHFVSEESFLQDIDFKGNEGSPAVSADGSIIYFSTNSAKIKSNKANSNTVQADKQGVSNLKIYAATYSSGVFESIEELPFNHKSYNCTHPALSADANSIYFSSDMPGGFGGYDLYVVKKDVNGNWGKPVNLGKAVNSEEHDIYPFVFEDRLFYSSKGLNGYGGYDIYTAKLNRTGLPTSPQNMGKPINSYRDDIAFITYGKGQHGYFSSNRDNDEGLDKVCYFHDLLIDNNPEFRQTQSIKPEIVKDTQKPKTPEKVASSKTEPENNVKPILPNTVSIDTTELEITDNDLLKLTFNNVQFGFNEVGLSSDMLHILDSVATSIRMGSSVRVQISAHTDSRGTDDYNKKLSDRRAAAARSYLLSKGVPASRIVARGYGETQLLNKCADGVECTDEEHQVNRRVELKLIR